jgi:LuxR family maltose regulon positive regulatory protein
VGAALAAPIERWLARFRDEQIAARATLALTAATAGALGGRRDAAERWTGAGVRMLAGAGREAEPSLRAGAAILRALIARDDVARMADDAARGYAVAPDDSPWRAVACLLAGIAHHLMDDRARAHDELEEGLRRAEPGGPAVQATCLAQLALLRLEADDWEEGAALALQAGEPAAAVDAGGARQGVLTFAVSAYACAHRGDVDRARRDALEGRRRLALPGQFPPWYEAETRIALARAELRLSNAAGARTLLAEASRALHRSPQAVVLRSWIDDAWERADTFAVGAVCGPTTLTTAELRVLRFLPSHLSFREVAARLHVSANTVKTQAHAV